MTSDWAARKVVGMDKRYGTKARKKENIGYLAKNEKDILKAPQTDFWNAATAGTA